MLGWGWAAPLGAQEPQGTVLGRVRDSEGAAVFAVTILLERGDTLVAAAETDRLGSFRIEGVSEGTYTLRTSRLGYSAEPRAVSVAAGAELDVEIVVERSVLEIEGVSVEAARSRERVRFEEIAGVTIREISLEEIRLVPGLAEADPVRAVEVLPGVISTSDLSAAYHVRGASADKNLILLDGVPLFSPFHLGGFVSVFNADMLDRVELQSGGFPAKHGGRVASVLTVESDPGDGQFTMDAGVSLLSSRLAVGGGMSPGIAGAVGLATGRWRVSARRSYFDVLLKRVFDLPYHLTDLQGVFEGWTPGGDRLDITAYHGRDVLNLTNFDPDDFPLRIRWNWGNDAVGARWTRLRRGGGSLSLKANFSRFGSGLEFPDFGDTDFRTDISQASVGAEWTLRPSGATGVTLGIDADRLAYDNLLATGGTVFNRGLGTGWLVGAHAQADWRRRDWLVEAGLRLDGWRPSPGEALAVPSPRLAVKRFLDGGRWAIKGAVGRYTQYLHSLRDEEIPVGLDIWVLAGDRAPHTSSDQIQLGVEMRPTDRWELSLEAYHRTFDGVVAFNPAQDPNDALDDILSGEGSSYGADLLIRRDGGRTNGWLTVSFLKAERSFEDVLSPLAPRPVISYAPIFDRRLDVDLVLSFPFFKGWDGGLRWNVGTGLPYTRPVGSFAFYRPKFADENGRLEWVGANEDGVTDGFAVLLGERNAERYPTYHRLDVTFRKEMLRSWGTMTPYLNILNVYNRRNVLFYFFEYDRSPPTRSGISMFPLVPTLGLEVSFR